ncbi:CPBP family intramembrane glutamic endopeptidase [Microbacterium hominis]|uniref:CPBP family intramembrane metalloprotease n=1 Tax=Microbacterium hominis TaxID=162426 RepID=A0A7D4UCC3_9MICO|nr:CPBP family intramembrane glutamic endopeptidase [Microbacterium hominis]QKJ20523.1 CPBP family intramembrane metalloprotease [Microbacterium hominis]
MTDATSTGMANSRRGLGGLRKEAKPIYGLLAYFVYVALLVLVQIAIGPDYTEIADSTENILRGIVAPIGAGIIGIVVLAQWLGWWRPALRDRHHAPRWVIIAPLIMAAICVVNIVNTDLGAFDATYLIVFTVGMLMVGFGEELTTRGLLIVGLRGRFSEVWVWLFSTLLFGAMHSINAFFGQSIMSTAQQVGLTLVFGTGFYLMRRATGSLIWAMLLHALWDWATFANGQHGQPSSIVQLLTIALYVAVIVGLIWAIKGANERLGAPSKSDA